MRALVNPKVFRPNEAAALARCSRSSLYQAIKTGALATHKIGGRRVILRADLAAWTGLPEDAFIEEDASTATRPPAPAPPVGERRIATAREVIEANAARDYSRVRLLAIRLACLTLEPRAWLEEASE